MKESATFHIIERNEWKELNKNTAAPLSHQELEELTGLNDRISLTDVEEVYVPIVQLLSIYMKHYEQLQAQKNNFLGQAVKKKPYIIGIAGSVAVGKSTTARLLQMMLSRVYKNKTVEMITTDGFLYPNEVLLKENLMDRKGFPESYDMPRLISFLGDIKNGKENMVSPVYSHEVYDIVEGEYHILNQPDILIVEGINILQLPANEQIYVSDFFDFSVYVDAEPAQIEKWYLERFGLLLDTAFTKPDNYYYSYAQGNREDAFAMARDVWKRVNLRNLTEYILPTRNRADLIIHKSGNHVIDQLLLRKY
ncbi:MAG: type I pantothenate kinase [Carnobacterium sp.]|uniref:Pantothenate kinase n=1 Tax=Carnobacterium antarcticum TaxID=2126436 RepID=A0ABW4NKH9_9LACT|nr:MULTISPECIES: type I pantothenate kinase [unclassified Carnobacterium]ALV21880.1 Pantothenate kinase [Carnobacterium sp. CP1]QQP69856.1 type I pantothenate kinase [Carnobacterium sp. CS13]